ncbi:MAG: hypothetical protein IKR69_03790 [Bacteroidales bacterium]|nr:hypothetical protein [Bacteroidales bacterium]
MRICVIGGANVDITARSVAAFRLGDSNPGRVDVSWGGVGRNIAHNLALLGNQVEFLTIFGGGLFAPVIEAACRDAGIDTTHCEIAGEGTNSFFVAIDNADGELIGGVADMNATEGVTPEWLAERIDLINSANAIVAEANLCADSLAYLIDHAEMPLYLDAVSVAKSARIKEAVALSKKKSFFALKCNAIEYQALESIEASIKRRYISRGAEGLKVESEGKVYEFAALPCIVRSTTGGGDALLSGIVHAGPDASIEESARAGLLCARCAVESPYAVSEQLKYLSI